MQHQSNAGRQRSSENNMRCENKVVWGGSSAAVTRESQTEWRGVEGGASGSAVAAKESALCVFFEQQL